MKSKFSLFFLFFIISVIFLSVGAIHANETVTIAKDTIKDHTSLDKNVEDKQIIKNKKSNSYNDKKQSSNIILNSTTFDDYVTVGNFNEKVNNGDTIDVQGVITSSNSINVNKKLNFISTTNDGTFNSGVFNVNGYSNGSTFTGLTFDNTRLHVASASNIVFDNISTLNIGKGIGAGIGSVSIREGSNNITLKNSYFLTNNNGGHSNVVFASAQNCLFENNTIESHGNVGNDFYITTYNVPAGLDPRSMNITIRNNTLRSTASGPITVGMVLSGYSHLIENNIIDKPGNSIMSQWSDPTWDDPETTVNNEIGNITFRNNQIVNAGSSLTFKGSVYNNSFTGASIKYSECYNNTFQTVSFLENTHFYNNTITKGNLSMGNNNIVESIHFLTGLNISGSNNTLSNISVNTTDLIPVDGDNNTFNNLLADTTKNINIAGSNNALANSTIYADEIFAITIKGNNNTLENLYVETGRLNGINAIYDHTKTNTMINITPENSAESFEITDDNYFDYFNTDGSITSTIPDNSVITFKGTFNDKDFILNNLKVDIMTDEFIVNNGTVSILGTSSFNISGLRINNRNSEKTRALIINSNNNNITELHIDDNGNKEDYKEIIISGNNNIIEGSVYINNDEKRTENPYGIVTVVESENNQIKIESTLAKYGESCNNSVALVLTETSKNNTISSGASFYSCYGDNITGIIISGSGNIINQTRSYIRQPNGRSIILKNANNTLIYGSYGIYANEVALTIINSNNNIITDINYISSDNNVTVLMINSTNNTIKNCNNISSTKMYTIELYNSSNNIIENNRIINNQTFGGDNAVYLDESSLNNTIFKNSFTLVKLDDETYSKYFTDGIWNEDYSAIQLTGDLYNKNLTFTKGIIIDGNGYTIYNGTITTNSNQSSIQNLIINNTNNNPAMLLKGQIQMINNTIDVSGNDLKIINLESGSLNGFANNTILGHGKNMTLLKINAGVQIEMSGNNVIAEGDNLVAIEITGLRQQSKFINNNITVNVGKSSKAMIINSGNVVMFNLNYNNFILNTDESSTLLELVSQLTNGNIKYNNFTLNSNGSSIIMDNKNVLMGCNISHNNFRINSQNVSTAAIFTKMQQTTTMDYNNFIINSNASSTLIDFKTTTSACSISYNNFLINSNNATTAIGFSLSASSPTVNYNNFTVYTNQSTNLISFNTVTRAQIKYNRILINTTQESVPVIKGTMGVLSEITNNYIESLDVLGDNAINLPRATINSNTPTNTIGRQVNMDIEDVNLKAAITSYIKINITNMFDETIEGTITATIEGEEIPITDNLFAYTPKKAGTLDIEYTYTDSESKYATTSVTKTYMIEVLPPQLSTENLTVADSTNITAYFYDENGVAANDGKAILRVNGKTLRDDKGEVIYIDVEDGKAVFENVNVSSEWMKEGTNIQAIYSGNDEFEPIFTQKTNVTVTKPEATITITSKLEAKAGDNITLSASVTCNGKAINSGRVVFKLNGKTLKDEDAKALYVDVKNGVATTNYILPVKTKAKKYTLIAVFTDTNYNRSEAEADFVVTS